MSQVGVSATQQPDGTMLLIFSTPENGMEYTVLWTREGYLDMLAALLRVSWGLSDAPLTSPRP